MHCNKSFNLQYELDLENCLFSPEKIPSWVEFWAKQFACVFKLQLNLYQLKLRTKPKLKHLSDLIELKTDRFEFGSTQFLPTYGCQWHERMTLHYLGVRCSDFATLTHLPYVNFFLFFLFFKGILMSVSLYVLVASAKEF